MEQDSHPTGPRAGRIKMVGGSLCLDFANTVDWRLAEAPEEILVSFSDLALWCRRAGILSAAQAGKLEQWADQEPAAAVKVLKKARELREAVFRVFSALARSARVKKTDLAVLNRFLTKAMSRAEVRPRAGGFVWDFSPSGGDPQALLGPIARSAAELLTSGSAGRVKMCGDERCGWLFLDTSRNRGRRWCDMSDCGNRAKARRFYQRKKDAPRKRAGR
ncbi:MAG: ABATE domain-containing protein [Thermodesulfobacteriota bacterium]